MSPTTSPTVGLRWRRVDGIDLLRGLAILFVLMNHVNMQLLGAHVPYLKGLPVQLAYTVAWNGQFGVQMFFAISGYLITSTSVRRWKTPAALSARDFYLLRFARIAPLMILLLVVLTALHLAAVPHFVVEKTTGGLGSALFAALTFHINFLEASRGYLPAGWDILWSLSVEEMFYLFFPWVARLLRGQRFLVPLLLLFVLAGPFARVRAFNPNPVWREYSYLGGMDAIALGCLTAMLLSNRRLSRRGISLCAAAGSALLIFTLGFSIQGYVWGLGKTGLNMTVLAIGTCLVIAAASQSSWRAPRILAPLLSMGRHSYEIYLTHIFVLLGIFAVFVHFGKPLHAVPWLFASTIVLASLFGLLVSANFSEPMNRLIRRKTSESPSQIGSVT